MTIYMAGRNILDNKAYFVITVTETETAVICNNWTETETDFKIP